MHECSWVHRCALGALQCELVLGPAFFEWSEEVESNLFDSVKPVPVDLDQCVRVAAGSNGGNAVRDTRLPQE